MSSAWASAATTRRGEASAITVSAATGQTASLPASGAGRARRRSVGAGGASAVPGPPRRAGGRGQRRAPIPKPHQRVDPPDGAPFRKGQPPPPAPQTPAPAGDDDPHRISPSPRGLLE